MVSYSRRVWGAAWLCTQGFKQCIKLRGYTPGGFQSKTIITSNSKRKWKKGITDSTLNAVACWTCSIIYTPSIAWGGVCMCVGSKAPPPFSISFMHLMKSISAWRKIGICMTWIWDFAGQVWSPWAALPGSRQEELLSSGSRGNPQAYKLSLFFLFCYQTSVLDS